MQYRRYIVLSVIMVILSLFKGTVATAQTTTIYGDQITKNSQAQVDEFRAGAISAIGNSITPEYEQNLNTLISMMKPMLDKIYLLDEALGVELGPDEVNNLDDAIRTEGYDFTIQSLQNDIEAVTSIMEAQILAPIKAKIKKEQKEEFDRLTDLGKKGQKEIKKTQERTNNIKASLEDKSTQEKLEALAASSNELSQKIEKELKVLREAEENFSNKVTSYVDQNSDIKPEDIEKLKANKKFVFAWDILQYAQYKRYIEGLEAQKEDAVNIANATELLSTTYNKLSKSDKSMANETIDELYINTKLMSKKFDSKVVPFVPNWVKGMGGSFLNMYLAISIKDSIHIATYGAAFGEHDPRKIEYRDKSGDVKQVVKNGKIVDVPVEGQNKYIAFLKKLATKYVTGGKITAATHLSTFAFVGSAELIKKFPASMIMSEYLGVSRSLLSSTTGKLIRGISGFSISMAVGAKMAEVVADGVIRWDSLFSDDPAIKDAARQLYEYEHGASKYNLKELSSFVLSFGTTEAAWWAVGKGASIKYKQYKLKTLNKTACDKGRASIIDALYNAATGTRTRRAVTGLANSSALFFVADVVDSRFTRPLLISTKETLEHENKVKELTAQTLDAEFNAMTSDIVKMYFSSSRNESYYNSYLASIYNKYDDYIDIEPYVEYFKKSSSKVKECLVSFDGGNNFETASYLYDNKQVSGPVMAYMCLQGFKDDSVDSFISVYSKNKVAKQEARKHKAQNVPVIQQAESDELLKKAANEGAEQKHDINAITKAGMIQTAREANIKNNSAKNYEAYIYAVNDHSFTESKEYLKTALEYQDPALPEALKTKFMNTMDNVANYYGSLNKNITTAQNVLLDLFTNDWPALLTKEDVIFRRMELKVLIVISELLYSDIKKMGYKQQELDVSMCHLSRALFTAHYDGNPDQFPTDNIGSRIKNNKDKFKYDDLYVELSYLIENEWGYNSDHCFKVTTKH